MGLMEWTAILGNVGEFLGSIAVLATLLYLAMQMRQNTQAMRSTAQREILRILADHDWDITRDPELAGMMQRWMSGELPSDPVESARFGCWMRAYTRRMEIVFKEDELGLAGHRAWERLEQFTSTVFRLPGFREFWISDKHMYDPDFARAIDSAVGSELGVTSWLKGGATGSPR